MAGRPTIYRTEYNDQAERLCKLGFTDAELAAFFEVDEATINRWKTKHPEFCKSLKRGKDLADAEVAEKLFKRATGYEHPDVDIKCYEGQIIETEIIKHYPPDTTAAIFWLKNRQRAKWRDKVEHGLTDGEGNDVPLHFYIPDNGRNKDSKAAEGLPGEST